MALAPLSDVNAGRVVILTAKPIAGHGAKGERRELRHQDDPAAAGALGLDPGPETGTSTGSSACPAPRQTAKPGNAAAEPPATAQQ